MCLYRHNMAYIRSKRFGDRTYYYLVEGRREEGKVRQKVIKYLGTSPHGREVSVDPSLAGPIAQALMSGELSAQDARKVLKKLGMQVTGRIKEINLKYKPPLRKLTLRVD